MSAGTGTTQWSTNVGRNWIDIEGAFKECFYLREVFEFTQEFLKSLNGSPTCGCDWRDQGSRGRGRGWRGDKAPNRLATRVIESGFST
jgi:hypothetical protein